MGAEANATSTVSVERSRLWGERSRCGKCKIQIREVQDKVNSLSDARDFHDPESASSSGASHVTSHPGTIPSSRNMLGRDSGLPLNIRNIVGFSRNVFERQLAQQGYPQDHFENSQNLASSSRGVRPEFTEQKFYTRIEDGPEQQDSPNSMTEPEADMGIKEWERRNSEFALYESRRELESQRFHRRQAITGQIRLRKKELACVEN